MTLPEPARRLWLLAYGAIEEHVNALSRGPHEIRLGGGTVLSARWKHRTSYDIDLTLSPEAKTTRLTAENNPALDAALRALRLPERRRRLDSRRAPHRCRRRSASAHDASPAGRSVRAAWIPDNTPIIT